MNVCACSFGPKYQNEYIRKCGMGECMCANLGMRDIPWNMWFDINFILLPIFAVSKCGLWTNELKKKTLCSKWIELSTTFKFKNLRKLFIF